MSNVRARPPIPSVLSYEKLSNDAALQQLLVEVGLVAEDVNVPNEPLYATVTDIDSLYGVDSITSQYSIPDTVPIESPIQMPKVSAGPSPIHVDTISLNVPDPLRAQIQLSPVCDDWPIASCQDRSLVTILPKPSQQGIHVVAWTAATTAVPKTTPEQRPPPRFNAITEQEEKR
jgi:hypothetical protein